MENNNKINLFPSPSNQPIIPTEINDQQTHEEKFENIETSPEKKIEGVALETLREVEKEKIEESKNEETPKVSFDNFLNGFAGLANILKDIESITNKISNPLIQNVPSNLTNKQQLQINNTFPLPQNDQFFDVTFSEKQMLQHSKPVLDGFIFHNENNSLGELIILKTYEQLRELRTQLGITKRGKPIMIKKGGFSRSTSITGKQNQHAYFMHQKDITDLQKDQIETCLKNLLKILEKLESSPIENEEKIKSKYSSIKVLWDETVSTLKTFPQFCNKLEEEEKNIAIKKTLKCLNYLNTVFTSEENFQQYLPFLTDKLHVFMRKKEIVVETNLSISLKTAFDQLEKIKRFTEYCLNAYQKDLCSKKCSKSLEGCLKILASYADFLSQSTQGRQLCSLLTNENFIDYSGTLDFKNYPIKKDFLTWKKGMEKLSNSLKSLSNEKSLQESKEFKSLVQTPLTLLDSMCKTVINCFDQHFDALDKIETFKLKNLPKNALLFNKTYTITKSIEGEIVNGLKDNSSEKNDQILQKIKDNLKVFNGIISKFSQSKKLFLDLKKKEQNLARCLEECSQILEEVKENINILEIKQSKSLTHPQIKTFDELRTLVLEAGKPAICFLAHDHQNSSINEKEQQEFINMLFPESMKDLEVHSSETVINNLQKTARVSSEHSFTLSIQMLLATHLKYLKIFNNLSLKIKSTLLPAEGESWKLTKNNCDKIQGQIHQLKAFGEVLESMEVFLKLDLEYLKENDCDQNLINMCQDLQNHLKHKLPSFVYFLTTTTPLLERWFKKSHVEMMKVKKEEKKKPLVIEKNVAEESQKPKETSSKNQLSQSPPKKSDAKKITKVVSEAKPSSKSETIPTKPKETRGDKKLSKAEKKKTKKTEPIKKPVNTTNLLSTIKQKPSPLEKLIGKTERAFEVFDIYDLKNNFLRLQEFQKGPKNALFHLHIIKECSSISIEKYPETLKLILPQAKTLAYESLLKSMLTARPQTMSKINQTHVLWGEDSLNRSHAGTKLYELFMQKKMKEIPLGISAMEEQLTHSVVGKLPNIPKELMAKDAKSTSEFIKGCLELLEEGHQHQKNITVKPLSEDALKKIQNQLSIFDLIDLKPLKKKETQESCPLENFKKFSNGLTSSKIMQKVGMESNKPGAYAQQRVLDVLNVVKELTRDPKIKVENPLFYCTSLATANNMLINNILHLCLNRFDMLEMKVKNRQLKHTHQPLVLWNLLKDKIEIDEKTKKHISQVLENADFDVRYPYGATHSKTFGLTRLLTLSQEGRKDLMPDIVASAEDAFNDTLKVVETLVTLTILCG